MSNKTVLQGFDNRNSLFELIPNDALLDHHPDTVITLRKLYNFNNEQELNEAITILDKWIQEQPHFKKKNFSRKYLEITLISLKGSIQRAKYQLDKLCTLKTVLPQFFDLSDPIAEFSCFKGIFQMALLPKLTKEHYRLFVSRFVRFGLDTDVYFKIFKLSTAICEYIKLHDYCDGYIVVADYRGLNVAEFLSEVSISDLGKLVTLVMKGYQLRLKAIHLVNESKTIDLLVKFFKQLFSKKIGQRIYTHVSFETVYECVPREILPIEFGGEEKSLEELQDNTLQVLASKENMNDLIEMRGATVDETMRPKGLEEYEMIGTFRSLSVD